jgi:hypothetical protein
MVMSHYSIDDLFSLPEKYLNPLGFSLRCTPSTTEKSKKILQIVKHCWFAFCIINLVVIHILQVVLFSRVPEAQTSEKFQVFLRTIFSLVRLLALCSQKKNIGAFIVGLEEVFENRLIRGEKCRDVTKYIRYFVMVIRGTNYCVIITLILFILVNGYDTLSERVWLPSGASDLLKNVVILWTIMLIILANYTVMINEAIMVTLTKLCALSFDRLNVKLRELADTSDAEKMINLKKFVEMHLRVIELKRSLEKIFSTVLFLQSVQCSGTICAIGIRLAEFGYFEDKFPLVCILIQDLSQFLSICYFGEQISEASLSIGHTIFSNMALDKNIKFKRSLLLITHYSQREQKIRAKGFKNISMATFSSVSKIKIYF